MTARRRQRGVLADATIAAGATILLLQSTSASTRSWLLTGIGIAIVLVGVALLWGVPRPTFRARMLASLSGLLVGFAAVASESPATYVALISGVLLLATMVWAAGRPNSS